MFTSRSALRGRDEVVTRILGVCTSRAARPLVLVTGPPGIGRSSVLARVRALLIERRVSTVDVPVVGEVQDVAHLVARLADELGVEPVRDGSSGALRRLLAMLAERRGRLVVFLDDADRIDPRSLATLASLIGTLAGTEVTFVCAFRTPSAGTEFDTLRTAGLVHEERLRPLSMSTVKQFLVDLLNAQPTPELVAELRKTSRGIPAVVRAAVEGYRKSGCLRIVDRHAYLVGDPIPRLPADHPLFADLVDPGSPVWPVIKALAVLHPLRGAVPALIAEVVGISEKQVVGALGTLQAAGVVLSGKRPGSWRFRVPMLATLLMSCLGPYERRRIAALAVIAIWNGAASCPDDNYLPERLVDAGKLVDPEPAATELLARSASVLPDGGDLADRWQRAAGRLIADPARHATALHRHAVMCTLHQEFRSAGDAADVVLRTYPDRLPADSLQELEIVYVVGLAGKVAELRDIVADDWRSMPGEQANRIVTRSAALCMLNRWKDAHDQLASGRDLWSQANAASATFGHVLSQAAGVMLGSASGLDMPVEGLDAADSTVDLARMLLRSFTLCCLDSTEPSPRPRSRPELAIQASFSGQWDRALDLAGSAIATASVRGGGHEQTAMLREMATILIARGQLNRARNVIQQARSQHLLLPHLVTVAEAEWEDTIGAHHRSRALVEQRLSVAAETGVIVGTDELWLRLAEWESRHGNPAAAGRCAARVARIAERLGTASARRNCLLARVLVQHDLDAADEVVRLTRERERPFELAGTLATVAESGLGEENLLSEAYGLFGELGALIPRARLRLVMRRRNITVPGRAATVAENERLLATLVAEGLTNQQLATVLGTSEKSVEGRLTRFFQRTGYRSRAELATATLSGEFPAIPTQRTQMAPARIA
ncbi:AAA family ATPase [Saccharopolyspora sp. 5N708]|uniref:AAA family ATPase n=1 Tax=Saccharopolyspora sp. 5N708 TaxID=3457424 RepID=UPI003FD520C8